MTEMPAYRPSEREIAITKTETVLQLQLCGLTLFSRQWVRPKKQRRPHTDIAGATYAETLYQR